MPECGELWEERPRSADAELPDGHAATSSTACAVPDSPASSASRSTSRGASVCLSDFRRKTLERVAAHCKVLRKKRSDRDSQPKKYGHIDVEEFRRETQKWVNQRQLAVFRVAPGS